MNPLKVGLLGCGKIAPAYLRNLTDTFSAQTEVVACADLAENLARERAEEFKVATVCSPDELLANPDVELVVNLTPAPVHYRVTKQILEAGKHCFTEKPLALTLEEGRELLTLARSHQVQLGGASETFLGGSHQKARALLDSGAIGTPLCATAFVSVSQFHAEHYHRAYRGALLDMGPYYITALVTLLGRCTRVSASADVRFPKKTHGPGSDKEDQSWQNDVASTVGGVLDLADGSVATLIATNDVHGYFPRVEIYGTKGRLTIGDANGHGGPILLEQTKQEAQKIESFEGLVIRGRGLGIAEMAQAIRENRPARASGELMFHVLEVMLAFDASSREGRRVAIESAVERPEPFDSKTL